VSKPDKLRIVPPARSPEREALGRAIAEAAPAVAAVDKARAAAEAARGQLASAVGAVPAAERAVAEAKAHIVDNPHATRAELRALRLAETDARNDFEIAREVASSAEAVLAEAERAARYAADRVESAVDGVVVASFAPALDAAECVGRQFGRLAFMAAFIAQSGDHWSGERTLLTGRVETLNAHFSFRGDTDAVAAARQEAQAPWHAARAALLADADAPLPRVG